MTLNGEREQTLSLIREISSRQTVQFSFWAGGKKKIPYVLTGRRVLRTPLVRDLLEDLTTRICL